MNNTKIQCSTTSDVITPVQLLLQWTPSNPATLLGNNQSVLIRGVGEELVLNLYYKETFQSGLNTRVATFQGSRWVHCNAIPEIATDTVCGPLQLASIYKIHSEIKATFSIRPKLLSSLYKGTKKQPKVCVYTTLPGVQTPQQPTKCSLELLQNR